MTSKRTRKANISIDGENVVGFVDADGNASVNISQNSAPGGLSDVHFERLFAAIAKQIHERPEDPNLDKNEIETQVEQIKVEAAKGEAANSVKLERWIRWLGQMAPDIVDVMAASLGGPVSVLTVTLKKIVERVQAESKAAGEKKSS